MKASMTLRTFAKNHVFNSLDEALMLAEDILIAREKPKLLVKTASLEFHGHDQLSLDDERILAARYISRLTPDGKNYDTKQAINALLSKATREEYMRDEVLWKQGDESDCAKLLLSGHLVARVDGTDSIEHVAHGNVLGEYGLIEHARRLSSVTVSSDKAVLYSISREAWEEISKTKPEAARILDRIAIRYLAQRVQHVSNRIIETRCLPV
jgi:SulP family sulfate permease